MTASMSSFRFLCSFSELQLFHALLRQFKCITNVSQDVMQDLAYSGIRRSLPPGLFRLCELPKVLEYSGKSIAAANAGHCPNFAKMSQRVAGVGCPIGLGMRPR